MAEFRRAKEQPSEAGSRHSEQVAVAEVPWDRRRDGRVLLLLFLVVWGVYLATASYTINQINDSRVTAQSAWSLGTQGTFALPEEWPDYRMYVEGTDGQTYTDRFPGPVLWGTPFYAVTEWVSPRGEVAHPWLLNYAPAGVAAATASALAVAVWFAVYRRIASRRLALLAAAALAFSTGMWSVAADALWTHGPGILMLGLGVLAMSSHRYAGSGAGFAAAILMRPQLAVVPAVVGIWEGVRRRSLRPVVVVGVVSAMGLAAMSLYSQVLFGTWLPIAGYTPGKVEAVATTGAVDTLERIAKTMAHPQRGIFLYTPVLLLLLPGLARGWRVAPDWVKSASVAGVVYLVVQLRSNVWHGGGNYFGYRLALETLVLASPLLLLVYQRFIAPVGLHRMVFAVVLLGSVVWHGLGATVMETGVRGIDGVAHWQENLEEFCELRPDLCDP